MTLKKKNFYDETIETVRGIDDVAICCVCGRHYNSRTGQIVKWRRDVFTHGYCPACLDKAMAEVDAYFKEKEK